MPCPSCPSSDAYHVWNDGHGYCFSCLTYTYGNKEFIDTLEANYTYEFLPWRAVQGTTFTTYDVKTKVDGSGKPISIGYRYPNGAYKVRDLSTKSFHSVGDIAKAGLFGRDKFSSGAHKYVTITEGELDACSLYQVLGGPCVSVQSAATARRDCVVDHEWLSGFDRIYLAFDNDTAGRNAVSAVAKLFDYSKIYHVKFTKYKDANDYLQHGEEAALKNIWWNSKKYLPETIISSFADFEIILKEPFKSGVSYPFPSWTAMTYGIRTGETVLITAQEGVGKTEVMHTIEHHLLKETSDAIGAIYLEESKRRHLQAIGGLVLRKPAHLPDVDCSESEVMAAIRSVVETDDRLHVFSHFGSDDPEHLLDTIRFLVSARGCRYVLLDHISMAVSGLQGEDERKALDFLITRLEMMVKELDFALILVSHVNDMGLTRGSRFISKVADIRIDLVRDLKSPDPVVRNITEVMISKNRFCGRTGPANALIFDPFTYTLSEIPYAQAANDNSEPPQLVLQRTG